MNNVAATSRSLAALGHEARLGVFRLLVRAGEDGLSVAEIGTHMGLPASTLAHHLRTLVDAGLVVQQRRGREIVSRVDYAEMRRILGFLSAECCVGVALTRTEPAA